MSSTPSTFQVDSEVGRCAEGSYFALGSRQRSHSLRWACIGAFFSSLLSFALLRYLPASSGRSLSVVDHERLRRPSVYLNLESAQSKDTQIRFPPIVTFSPFVLQVLLSDPLRPLREDTTLQRHTSKGTVYPDDRHFLVSNKTSTIMQFRGVDFDMERCILFASIPNVTLEVESDSELADTQTVDVWRLDTLVELSWRSLRDPAPGRLDLLTTLAFRPDGKPTSTEYVCPSGGFSTFEFVCSASTPNCYLDFWQAQTVPANGIASFSYIGFRRS
ncbi:hypothetical protein BJ138DRAFT_1118756 [Hygrophoropsis aurantiaca]|uniref:Uncharacterized protein n=1 Tax=Hygrophoropsis aurantiaca TaxID=72124 RepID=A0ACB7ZWH4_9AGAM|nr:hypothetical protein BJ138DRAFT_1118756 [Hygrophoropsis aurantiaca]